MSAAVLPAPASSRGAASRPGLGRVVLVELRKMSDTRAGFWLLAGTALLTVAVAVIAAVAAPDDAATLVNYFALCLIPASVPLPVMGILLVTSEWSQRTAMITFALVPRRGRVLAAMLLAGMARALVAFQLCLVVALVTTAVAGRGGDDTWALSAAIIGQAVDPDAHRHRLRGSPPRLRTGHRPLLRAPDRVRRPRLAQRARGRRALARPVALDRMARRPERRACPVRV